MLFLWVFGNNVEDAMGRVKFVFFYLRRGPCRAGAADRRRAGRGGADAGRGAARSPACSAACAAMCCISSIVSRSGTDRAPADRQRQFVLDYGLLGDVLMEQGRLTEAPTAYQKMIDLKPFYQSYTRAAHLRWLKGDLDGAIELIRKAIAAARPRDPESIAWAYTRLAGYELQRGRLDDAERAADSALSIPTGLRGRLARCAAGCSSR